MWESRLMLELPPLILHPFHERVPAEALLENSKAALMLSGLIPNDGSPEEELQHRILRGRYGEVRMLFFLGKDIFRWLDQCAEFVERLPGLQSSALKRQSFAEFLTNRPPDAVREKLIGWGVADYISIFRRAIGLNAMFANAPAFDALSEEFLRNYHRYANALHRCFMEAEPHGAVDQRAFYFALYASGEYSRILETEWAAS
jgi:hypothetical protein